MSIALRCIAAGSIAAGSIAFAFVGCDTSRSLDELEEATAGSTAEVEAEQLTPLASGFARQSALFAANARPITDVAIETLDGVDFIDRSVQLSTGTCYTMLAYAWPDTTDLDLRLDRPDSWAVARDLAPDHFPAITSYCPEESGTFNLRLIVRNGGGEAMWRIFIDPSTSVPEGAQRLDALRQDYAASATAVGPIHQGWVRTGQSLEMPVVLLPRECYAFAAVSAVGMDLDLFVSDPEGQIVSADTGLDDGPVVPEVCVQTGGTYTLRMRSHVASGPVAWQVFRFDGRRLSRPTRGR